MANKVAIVGIGQTNHKAKRPDVNHQELVNEAVKIALNDAQITMKDIDTVVIGNMDLFEGHYISDSMMVDVSGAYMKPGLKMNTGGTTGGTLVATGWNHIASGLFGTCLVIGWQKQDAIPSISALVTTREPLYDRDYAAGAVGIFATWGLRYMLESGCKEEHAAMARVISSEHAARNPHSHVRRRVTLADVMNSRVIVWPVRLLHMSPQSCGTCAIVLANEERAKKISKKPVWIVDHITAHRENSIWAGGCIEPIPSPSSLEAASTKLYKRNGITNPRKEVDVWEIYDPSSWGMLQFMEWYHICGKGEAWKLVEKNETLYTGSVPMCPSGGVVCTNPIGASGALRVAEAALQIRGDAGERQVTKKVNTAVATAWGGCNWCVMFLLKKNL